jgi:long-chain acyl-CoA synthetase
MKTEGIEALVYPNEESFKESSREETERRINEIVKEVNYELVPYKRIGRVQVLEQPMEMTTTKKIKRHKVEPS